jgi:hypothetical protein
MTAAFNRLCESIPKSVNCDDLRRQLARIVLRHVDRGVQDPERLYEITFREFAGLDGSASQRWAPVARRPGDKARRSCR